MAFRSKAVPTLLFIFGLWIIVFNFSAAEPIPTTTEVAQVGAKRCYKCEGDCNGGPGKVEECRPGSDTLIFACYTIMVEGKPFQRGCTVDFSGGEDCVKEKGNMYCFCQTDECNKSLGSWLSPTRFETTILFSIIICLISSNILVILGDLA